MSLQTSFGYSGKKFSVVNDDCICFIAANAVCVWNTATGKKDFLWSKKNGYTACTANYMKGFIAAAEYGLNPDIHIYKYPGNQMVAKLKAETTIQCIDLIFSRDCTRLLMIGDKPDYKISIYDIEERKMLTINEKLKDKNYLKAAFNPADPDQFFVASPNNLTFYSIIRNSYTITKENGEGSINKCERVNSSIYAPESPDLVYIDIIWDPYSKLYIATDQKQVHQIDFNSGEEKAKLNLDELPLGLILTQKHLIVALENKKVLWYSALPPEERITTMQVLQKDKLIRLENEISQEYLFENGGIRHMAYTKNFKKLVFGCDDGFIATLPVEAEIFNDEEEEDDGNAKEMKVINTPLSELGKFHTKAINGIKELGETTQVVTVADDHLFCIWEATSGSCLARENIGCCLTALEVSDDGNKVFIGSEGGVVRIYDVSNRCMPRLVKMHRFYDTSIKRIVRSLDDRTIAVISEQSDEICFFHASEKNEFDFICYYKAHSKLVDICWNNKDKDLRLIGLTDNFLILSLKVMVTNIDNKRVPIPDEVCFPFYTKVDNGCYALCSDQEIYVIGNDRFLKTYNLPNEDYNTIDWKKSANPPVEEFKSHGILTTCFDFSKEADFMVSGGKDGSLILRNRKKLNQFSEIKGHSIFTGGVKSLCFSKKRTVLYSAGGDGTFLCWSVGQAPNPLQPIEPADFFSSPDLSNIPQIENTGDSSVKYYKDLLEEQFLSSEGPRREEFRAYLTKELKSLQNKLYELLEDNKKAQEIEQLKRDEFVIDLKKKKVLDEKGEKERDKIRKDAKRKELELECLRERVKNNTWDIMSTHTTACVSLDLRSYVYNYGIRERTKDEKRKLKQVHHFRRIELREKISGLQTELDTILSQTNFSSREEKYIMNRENGAQYYEKDESAPEANIIKSPVKKKKEKKEWGEDANANKDSNAPKGKRKPKVDLNQFRLGANKPKEIDDDEALEKAKERNVNRDETNLEELKWRIMIKKKELEDLAKEINTLGSWELLYEPFELYTDARKRMQIEILEDIIFLIKEEFNKEFIEFQKMKEDQIIFRIGEKNGRIKEILDELMTTAELYEPKQSLLETPEHILNVTPAEITIEKHLTAEEKAIEDEKRRVEEERLKALEGDNVGQRGIKMMMGGTLEMKKNKGIMQETLEREEWMNKPIEDMNEEEKQKLKEFEQKEKELQEEKEKKKKAWDQELRKLRTEIDELCFKFEDELRSFQKKRLYYDMRIYEQELYIIRLTLMLHETKEIKEEEKTISEKKTKLESELEEAGYAITRFTEMYDDFENKFRENTAIGDQEKSLRQKFPNNNRQILNFVKNGGKSANRAQTFGANQEGSAREQELMSQLCELDPYIIVDSNAVKKMIAEENAKEHYSFEKDKIQGVNTPEEFEVVVQERMNRIEMNKQREKMEEEINHIKEHKTFCEFNATELEEAYAEIKESHTEIVNRMVKLKYNFELVVYLLQGQIEVPQAPVATDYKDAILIKTKVIEEENSEVVSRGNKNVDILMKIATSKKKLYQANWENDKLVLEIKDYTERAIDVQLYKVKKETQEIIKGNHRTKDEDEKKRIESQIKQFEENAKARIKTINEKKKKLKKEIKNKQQENIQLEMRARQLQQNVDQRKQIMELRSKGTDDNVQDPKKRFGEIAAIRKYKEIVEQQKEEIEFLEDELERHRSRTFPSFANMHSKQDYAD